MVRLEDIFGPTDLMTKGEIKEAFETIEAVLNLSGTGIDVLIQLRDGGPVEDGGLISKSGRDELLKHRLAEKVVVKGKQGYQACNYRGWAAAKLVEAKKELLPPRIVIPEIKPGLPPISGGGSSGTNSDFVWERTDSGNSFSGGGGVVSTPEKPLHRLQIAERATISTTYNKLAYKADNRFTVLHYRLNGEDFLATNDDHDLAGIRLASFHATGIGLAAGKHEFSVVARDNETDEIIQSNTCTITMLTDKQDAELQMQVAKIVCDPTRRRPPAAWNISDKADKAWAKHERSSLAALFYEQGLYTAALLKLMEMTKGIGAIETTASEIELLRKVQQKLGLGSLVLSS
jgi:hypothetical protein